MPDFVYPASELDDARRLVGLLGSFWSTVYGGTELAGEVAYARGQLTVQANLDFAELLAAVSRFTVPVFHTDNWHLLTLTESHRNAANLAKFDGTHRFDDGLLFDQPLDATLHAWPAPADLVDVKVAMNGVAVADVVLTQGVDFYLADGQIWFRENPFDNPKIQTADVIAGGAAVDRTLGLWLYRGKYDWDTVYEQFGYAIDARMRSGLPAREFVNAVFDGLVEGTSRRAVEQFFAALADVPLARGSETVAVVAEDRRGLLVVTDKTAYRFAAGSTPLVSVGDAVEAGDPLVDTLLFFAFGTGSTPAASALQALAMGRGMLASGFYADLVFENKDVPLVVEEGVAGYTKVSWALGGFPGDVEEFWDRTHADGVAKGQTLAMLMDRRTNRDGQPTAMALPATVNPLTFLTQNVLRNNAYVVVLRPSKFGANAPGMAHARLLRKLVPPHTVCLVVVRLEAGADAVTMDGPGTEVRPGYTESVRTYAGTRADETVDPAQYVTESVTCRHLRGRCE